MNNTVKILSLVALCAGILSSCGTDDPQGQFVDSSKNTADNTSENQKRYIENLPPSKWEADWSTANIVVFQWRGEPANLHPTNGFDQSRMTVFDYTQRFLVRLDFQTLELLPDLITRLPEESADAMTYTYTLKSGVTWDDGSPLTVDDVIFTIMANACPSTNNPMYKPAFEFMKAIEKDPADPQKFRMVMTQKYIQNVSVFTNFPILQEKMYDPKQTLRAYKIDQFVNPDFAQTTHADLEAWSKDFNDETNGTDIKKLNGLGPYEITDWQVHQKMVLKRKKQHWTFNLAERTMYDESFPDEIIFREVTDEAAVELEFRNQTMDASCGMSTRCLVTLQKDSAFNRNYHSAFVPNYDWQYIGFNLRPEAVNRTPFFTDVRVRRAIAMLIPADEMNQAYLEGQAVRMTSIVCATRPDAYNSDLKPVAYNVEEAKKLLDEAGWKDTDGDNVRDKMINGKKVKFEFELKTMTGNAVMAMMGPDIKNSIKLAGVICNVTSEDPGVLQNQSLPQHNFDMIFSAWSGSSQPEDFKQLWHSSSWENGGSNYTGYSNPKADELIDKIRVQTVDSLRIPMEKELQKIIYDDQPYVFMYQLPRKTVIHKRFANANMYWEKPGVYLSFLKLLTPATMSMQAR